jgi:hypothetical protein
MWAALARKVGRWGYCGNNLGAEAARGAHFVCRMRRNLTVAHRKHNYLAIAVLPWASGLGVQIGPHARHTSGAQNTATELHC